MKKSKSFILIVIVCAVIGGFIGSRSSSSTKSATVSNSVNKSIATAKSTEMIELTPSPSPSPSPTVVPELKSGDNGDSVLELQNLLSHYGYFETVSDGNYNEKTVKAIKDFQINNHLPESGICDQSTWKTIKGNYPVRQQVVFKSKNGKVYHSNSTCSGMKTATEMTLSDALRKGLKPCSHCH